jgi:hypothetical protein
VTISAQIIESPKCSIRITLFLLIFALFAHQYLLELFRKNIDVSGEEGKQI